MSFIKHLKSLNRRIGKYRFLTKFRKRGKYENFRRTRKEYKDWYDKNSDGYGRACFTYAERWAEMLENKIESSTEDAMKVIVDNADKLSHEADTEGITGYMYGCAVSILSQCWKYGEYLRKWHNKEYNYDGDGVVNPAILTIG